MAVQQFGVTINVKCVNLTPPPFFVTAKTETG